MASHTLTNGTTRGASIHDLSTELIVQIAEYFLPARYGLPPWRSDGYARREAAPAEEDGELVLNCRLLARMCGASRLLHSILTPMLYECVVLECTEDLVLFYRTLATAPRLRNLIRTLAFEGNLFRFAALGQSSDDEDQGAGGKSARTAGADDVQKLIGEWWGDGTDWLPKDADGVFMASHIGIGDLLSLSASNVLAAVLGLATEVRRLELPLGYAQSRLAEMEVADLDIGSSIKKLVCPDSVPSSGVVPAVFQCLEEVAIVCKDLTDEPRHHNPARILDNLVRHCSTLRCISVRGPIWMARLVGLRLCSEAFKEFTLSGCPDSYNTMRLIPLAFPQLTVLHTEWLSDKGILWRPFATAWDRLVDLPLETLTVIWNQLPPEGAYQSDMAMDLPPLLRSALPGIKTLKNLSVDCFWIMDRNNLKSDPEVTEILPPSLETLHIIDRWGLTKRDPFERLARLFVQDVLPTTSQILAQRATYMDLWLRDLATGCADGRLGKLRSLKVTSDLFDHPEADDELRARMRALVGEYEGVFEKEDVRLVLVGFGEPVEETVITARCV